MPAGIVTHGRPSVVQFLLNNELPVLVRPNGASPGALGTPSISGAGCARIGQTITIGSTGPAFGIGILATGFQTNVPYLNLTVLQSTSVTVVSVLNAAGQGSLPLLVPLDPTLGNSHVYFQAAYLDASTSSGLIASPGLDILLR